MTPNATTRSDCPEEIRKGDAIHFDFSDSKVVQCGMCSEPLVSDDDLRRGACYSCWSSEKNL